MKRQFAKTILGFGLLAFSGSFAAAAIRTVDNNSDIGALSVCSSAVNDCSLRGAISGAAAGDTINFDLGVFAGAQIITLGGTGNPLVINKNLTISGTGANKLTVSGNDASLVFDIGNFTFNLSGMTITGGNSRVGNNNAAGGGIVNSGTTTITDCVITANRSGTDASYTGGIYNFNSLTIVGSTISNNTARYIASQNGGGISSQGTILNITNSTISGNTVDSSGGGNNGGGILNFSGNAIITNCTITKNTGSSVVNSASGIVVVNGTVTVRNSIVAANTNNGIFPDVAGAFATIGGGSNVIGNVGTATGFAQTGDQTGTGAVPLDPKLGALTIINGGTTPTHALLTNSPAINKGSNCVTTNICTPAVSTGALLTDQRGSSFPRQFGMSNVDVGALESDFLAPTAATVSISGRILTLDGRGLRDATVSLNDTAGNTRTARTSTFGYYRFDEVEAGQTYIITVHSKRYQFAPQVISATEDIAGLNFTANQAIGSLE